MTKKTIFILTSAFVIAALIPALGVQWTHSPGTDATSPAVLSVAEQSPTPTCSPKPSGLPQITWYNASSAAAGVFDCVDCLDAFEQCYNDCKVEPDTPGEVACQENCVITIAECLGSCGA